MGKTEPQNDPVLVQTQRHIAELMEIVENMRERERSAGTSEAQVLAARARVSALVAIHEAKMALFQYQQSMDYQRMMQAASGLVVPA